MAVNLDPIVLRHVDEFNEKRLEAIEKLNLRDLLRKKNPYLFIARGVSSPTELVEVLVNAAISSSEETLFGQTLENIAIDVCNEAFGGIKSGATGIDLDFTRDDTRYVVAIKSGPNWGNSSQIAKMRDDFRRTIRVVRQGQPNLDIRAINGCCYGTPNTDRGDYRKVCGAAFWELISGEPNLFTRLASSLQKASTNGYADELEESTDSIVSDLEEEWCDDDGELDWSRTVITNSWRR